MKAAKNFMMPNTSNIIEKTRQPNLNPMYSVRSDEAIGPIIDPKAKAPVLIAETLFFILSMFRFLPRRI